MTSNTILLAKLDHALFTHSWHFCYNSMTVNVISFKPQKGCTMIVTPYTDRFLNNSVKRFTLEV